MNLKRNKIQMSLRKFIIISVVFFSCQSRKEKTVVPEAIAPVAVKSIKNDSAAHKKIVITNPIATDDTTSLDYLLDVLKDENTKLPNVYWTNKLNHVIQFPLSGFDSAHMS